MVSLFAYYYHVQYFTLLGLFIVDRNYHLPKTNLTLFHNVGMEIQNNNFNRKQILYFKTITLLCTCLVVSKFLISTWVGTFQPFKDLRLG